MPISDLHKKKLKKNLTILAIIAGLCLLIYAVTMIRITSAEAAEIYECGAPTTYELETESNADLCDVYSRQIAYRDEAIKFRKQIRQRAESFIIPTVEARKNYLENLQKLHDSIPSDSEKIASE
jgi:hypothetical protein